MRFEQLNLRYIWGYILLSCFVIGWYLLGNKYLCIIYREQAQMFLFSCSYLSGYISQPGGITAYIASFLTQFFYNPVAGAGIYLLIFWVLYKVFGLVLKELLLFQKMPFVALIPSLLFLPASTNMQFDMADELAVIFALSGFLVLVKASRYQYDYLLVPLAVSLLYVFIGGSFILSWGLFVLYLFTHRKFSLKQAIVLIASFFIPLIFRYVVYLVSVENAYYVRTPLHYPDFKPGDFPAIAWVSVCLIPMIGIVLKNIRLSVKWLLYINISLIIVALFVVAISYNSNTEHIVQMGIDAENNRWERILDTNAKTSTGPFNCFYTNLALQKTGRLADKMFAYDQIGLSGLIIDSQDAFSCNVRSEFFYQMGLINEAQHQAYESMVGYSYLKEPDVRNMKKLLTCALIRKDTLLLEKYESLLGKTLLYRNFRKEQDKGSELPAKVKMENMFMNDISGVLTAILDKDPYNKAAFEYLMAYYMLERDYENTKNCYDRYFANFSYQGIPVHYAEFLVLYKRLNDLDDDFYEHYPVPRDIREHFDIMDTLISAEMTEQIKNILEERYKDSYWFYVRFPLVNTRIIENNEKYIY